MNIVLLGLGLAAVAVILVGAAGTLMFARRAAEIAARLESATRPVDVSARLPQMVRDFALRADASPGDLASCVQFTQNVEMQMKPGQVWQPLQATQTVATGTPGFIWQAHQPVGPLPKYRVIDAYVSGRGSLQVWLLGLWRVANASGPEIDRGEALRYLAELPWAPDAILGNPEIAWHMPDDTHAEAALDLGESRAVVRFGFDAAGDIVEVYAASRPMTDDQGNPATCPWQGYFRDYRMIGPRRVPAEAEAGYIRPEGYRAYFQGRITGYTATH